MSREIAPLPKLIAPDLVKEMAMDIGKEVAAYIERQYPNAVSATSGTFLLSVRNTVYNEILAALKETDPVAIANRLADRKMARRKLRALWKGARTVTPETPAEDVDMLLSGALTAPDVCEDRE